MLCKRAANLEKTREKIRVQTTIKTMITSLPERRSRSLICESLGNRVLIDYALRNHLLPKKYIRRIMAVCKDLNIITELFNVNLRVYRDIIELFDVKVRVHRDRTFIPIIFLPGMDSRSQLTPNPTNLVYIHYVLPAVKRQ